MNSKSNFLFHLEISTSKLVKSKASSLYQYFACKLWLWRPFHNSYQLLIKRPSKSAQLFEWYKYLALFTFEIIRYHSYLHYLKNYHCQKKMASLVWFVHRLTFLFVASCIGLISFSVEAAIKRYQFDVSYKLFQ